MVQLYCRLLLGSSVLASSLPWCVEGAPKWPSLAPKFAMKAPPPPPPPDTVLQHAHEILRTRTRKWQAREKQAKNRHAKNRPCGARKPRYEEKWGTRQGRGGGTKTRRAAEHSASPPVACIALARRNSSMTSLRRATLATIAILLVVLRVAWVAGGARVFAYRTLYSCTVPFYCTPVL